MILFKKKKRHQETGRSMIEMLSVIALIGVLSIGGIAGYKMAMNKYKTNELLNQSNKFVELCTIKKQQNPAINVDCSGIISELGKNILPDTWSFSSDANSKTFSLTIPSVEKAVCQNMSQSGWSRLLSMHISTPEGEKITESGKNCPINGTISLTFADNPSTYIGSNTEDEKPSTSDEPDEPCSGIQIWYEGECVDPSSCPTNTFRDSGGSCIPCSDPNSYTTSNFHCNTCSERIMDWNGCSLRTKKCEKNEFYDFLSGCISCGSPEYSTSTTKSECDKCGDKRGFDTNHGDYCYLKNNCPSGMFDTFSQGCQNCTDSNSYPAAEEECNKCGDNRLQSYGECALKEKCPSGFISTLWSGCIDCNGDDFSAYTSKEECAKCGNKRWYTEGSTDCRKNECGTNSNMFNTFYDGCQSCDSSGSYAAQESECHKCGNKRVLFGRNCEKNTPTYCEDGSFYSTFGCLSCDDQSSGGTTLKSECDKCGNKRIYDSKQAMCFFR